MADEAILGQLAGVGKAVDALADLCDDGGGGRDVEEVVSYEDAVGNLADLDPHVFLAR